MKLLFCASEAYPYVKSGGLADVAHALPIALQKSGKVSVTRIIPLYRFAKKPATMVSFLHEEIAFAGARFKVIYYRTFEEEIETIFVESHILSDVDRLYGLDNDALRFTLFSRAIVGYARKERFDIIHLNDWHTALAALFVKEFALPSKIVFTIHNLAFQGVFDASWISVLGISPHYFHMDLLEFYGKINFMKAAIAFSDALTTVSPTYVKEIQTPEYGCGLDGFLRKYAYKLQGIRNGIDTETFNPSADETLSCRYRGDLAGFKTCSKAALLRVKTDLPLFIFIGRLTEQKGIDLILKLSKEIARLPMLLAMIGEGEERFVKACEAIDAKAANISFYRGYDEALAHRMYAAADFLLMPSRFEPCGLNQMIAMRYGAVPVVHKTGGLADTVHREAVCGQGILFETFTPEALLAALQEALQYYHDRERFQKTEYFNFHCDFSFAKPAEEYLALYEELTEEEKINKIR